MLQNLIPGTGPFAEFGILAILAFLLVAVWSIVWKGLALWTASHEGSKPWFIVLLVVNTAGLLEIVYLVFFSNKGAKYFAKWKDRGAKTQSDDKPAH